MYCWLTPQRHKVLTMSNVAWTRTERTEGPIDIPRVGRRWAEAQGSTWCEGSRGPTWPEDFTEIAEEPELIYGSVVTCFHASFLLDLLSILKMEAIFSLEASVDFQRTTRRYSPEDGTIHKHSYKNLKSGLFNIPKLVSQNFWLRHKMREVSEVIQKSLFRLGDYSS